MQQIIYLEIDDDIQTVRDRLRRAQSKQLVLVIPGGCKALRRSLDFCLLRRQVAALDLELALVSDSATFRELAQEEGLTVFSLLSAAQRATEKKSRATGRQSRWKTADLPGLEGLRARFRRTQGPGWWRWLLGPVAMFCAVFALAALVLTIWPSATVSVAPAREPIGVSIWIEADVSTRMVDLERQRMPARIVQIDVVDRGQVETTGVTNVAADHAVGTVLLINLTQRELSIPAETIVSTSAGTPVRFRTTIDAAVNPRGRVRVPIEALEGGPSGNVRAFLINRIEGGLSSSLSVTNESGTSGGTTDQVRRVTHGDKQRVSDLLMEMLIRKGHAELSAILEEQGEAREFLPVETMWVNEYSIRTNYDQHVNDKADTLALEMRGIVGGIAISEDTAREITERALHRKVRGGFRLAPESVHISRGPTEVDPDTGMVRFVMDGVAYMEADIDVRLLQSAIRGRSIDEALAYLRQTLPTEMAPVLQVEPEWMLRVPWLPFRISVVWQEPGDLQGPEDEVARALPGP